MPEASPYEVPGAKAVATKDTKRQVRAILGNVSDDIAKLPEPFLARLLPVLNEAERELTAGLKKYLRTVKDGKHKFTGHQMRSMLRQIREARKAISRLKPSLKDALKDGSVAAVGLSDAWLTREMQRLTVVFGELSIPQLNISSIEHFMSKNRWVLSRPGKLSDRYTKKALLALRHQFAVGVAKGESIDQMVTRIMRLKVGEGGYLGLADDNVASKMAAGLFKGNYSDASRLVRTETMNAYNAHHQESIREISSDFPGMRKRWDASADRHCSLCAAVDGETIPEDEEFSSGDMHPPLHPHCRCVVIPWMAHWPEVKPLPPLDTADAKRHPATLNPDGGAVVTRGGTAAETNRVLDKGTKGTK